MTAGVDVIVGSNVCVVVGATEGVKVMDSVGWIVAGEGVVTIGVALSTTGVGLRTIGVRDGTGVGGL